MLEGEHCPIEVATARALVSERYVLVSVGKVRYRRCCTLALGYRKHPSIALAVQILSKFAAKLLS
jgi:hypothetical protein